MLCLYVIAISRLGQRPNEILLSPQAPRSPRFGGLGIKRHRRGTWHRSPLRCDRLEVMRSCGLVRPQCLVQWTLHIGLLLWLALQSGGCQLGAEIRDDDPLEVLVAWQAALEAGLPAEAWSLLTPEAREGLSESAFVEVYRRQAPTLVRQAGEMVDWARARPPEERADVVVGDRRLTLVRTRSGWRVDGHASTHPALKETAE
jgi:hypothetical protein